MAWTSRIVHIDEETAEVLDFQKTHNKTDWQLTNKENILNKITPTHYEKIIIYKYRKSKQQSIW